ncbi:MAG: polysaccharide deacetylase family protein [Elusimicrobiales bacterium]|nr:polysaccharide deacetylase family protein [Elusimicrobiales bacterium]
MMVKILLITYIFLFSDDKKYVYLTVDDGPSSITNQICDLLSKYNAKATFFVLGENVKRYPDMLKRIYLDGHLVASHTYSHINFCKLKNENKQLLVSEIKKTEVEIFKIINYKPSYLRYPYGCYSKKVINIAKELGYKVVNWDFGYDWHSYNEERIISEYLKNLKHKNIILVHDSPKRNKMVLRVIEEILKEGKRKNLNFIRLDESY